MKLKIKYLVLFIIVVFNNMVQAQNKSVNTANVDFRYSDEKVYISYDIVNYTPKERYNITVSVFQENGVKLNAVNLSGELSEVVGGNGKTIIWELKKDGYFLNEKIYISLTIHTKVSIPVATHLLKSAVYPGWGDYKIRNGKYHFLYGVAGFGAIGASIYMNSLSQKSYTSYKKSFDYSESNSLFNKAKQQQNISSVFALTAGLVWTIDLACLYGKISKTKKKMIEKNSTYYFKKSQETNSFASAAGYIDTKLSYGVALESADKSGQKNRAPASLKVPTVVFNDSKGNGNNVLDVNENACFEFILSNKGKGDAYNLVLDLNEKNHIKGIEYIKGEIIGYLPAGKDTTISIPISGTMQLETGKAEFEILIREENGFDADPIHVSLNTQSFKSAQLEVADYKFTTNDDGKIYLGEKVYLTVGVQNTGQGEANDIIVNFLNPENVYDVNGTSYPIGKLMPNEHSQISYGFMANKRIVGSEVPIKVVISESYNKYGETKILSAFIDRSLSQPQQINVNSKIEKPVIIDKFSFKSDVDKDIPLNNITDENKFALIIGDEDYSSYQRGISNEMNVEFAINDASVFKEYCIKTFGVPENNILFLKNATVGQLSQNIDLISKQIRNAKGEASVIVYYAGHGLPDEKTKEPYLIPVDVSGSDISSAIKLSYLYGKLTEFPSRQVTVFLDACFSGGGREAGLMATRGIKITPKADNLNGKIVVFAASSGEESSLPWKDKQHGMFTYFLLKKFQETKGDVSFSELGTFLTDKVGRQSLSINHKDQSPQTLFSNDVKDTWGKWKLK